MALVALIPSGLQTLNQAAIESSLSAIRKEVRSEMNTVNFADLSGSNAIYSYYDHSGRYLPVSAPAMDRFFELRLTSSAPEITGQAGGFESSARRVKLLITYPALAPASSQTTNISTLLVARQASQ